MSKNKDLEGVHYRYVPPPEKLSGVDVYGKRVVYKEKCTCCGKKKYLSEFYWVSQKNAHYDRKPWCTVCWSADTKKRTQEKGYATKEYLDERDQKVLCEILKIQTLEEFFV